jgi:hypothetical protein
MGQNTSCLIYIAIESHSFSSSKIKKTGSEVIQKEAQVVILLTQVEVHSSAQLILEWSQIQITVPKQRTITTSPKQVVPRGQVGEETLIALLWDVSTLTKLAPCSLQKRKKIKRWNRIHT